MQSLNRTLFISDNLPVLRGIDSESIDLIATDPPFNKGVKAFEGITAAGENISYKDVWTWSDVQQEWWTTIREEHRSLYEVIDAANHAAGDDMGAFLCWLGVRVLEMHRVLKPTGSLYLHCDHTAGAWIKTMLDAVFGRRNFRNEVVWQRTLAKGLMTRQLPSNHDLILGYQKTMDATWHTDSTFIPYDENKLAPKTAAKYSHRDPDGRLYRLDNLTNPNPNRPNLTYEFLGVTRVWRWTRERMKAAYDRGLIIQTRPGSVPQLKRYLDEQRGRPLGDVWVDIPPINSQAKERTGYPTQKPLALYERIIKASSNPGDMVLDPFAGCATTCVAAERLGRQWVGIDLNEPARDIIRERLQHEVSQSMAWGEIVRTPADPPERTDGGEAVAPELVVVSRKRNARRLPVREIRERLIISDGMRCQGCGWEPPYSDYLQVDHKKPRSLGGVDEMDNFALLCDPCNRFKSNKLTLAELRQVRVEEERMNADWWQEERWR